MAKQKTKLLLKLLVVFSISVIAGVRYFSIERGNPLNGPDQITYNYLAEQLLHGRIYAENWPTENHFRAWRPPGYPIFLALLLWLGQNNLQFIISIQYLLLVFTGISVFYLGSKISHSFFGGLLGCIAFFSFAPIGYYASLILSETIFMFGLCFFLIFLYEGLRTMHAVFYICAGCLLGLSTVVRTVTLPFLCAGILLIIIGWTVLKIPKCTVMLRNFTLLIAFAWLAVIPITLRNFLVLHAFVPVATADGMNFYFGTKSPLNWDNEHETTVNPLRKEFGEVGSRNELLKLAVKTISSNPIKYLLHKLETIGKYVMPNLHYIDLPGFLHYTKTIELTVHVLFLIGCLTLVLRQDLWSCVFLLFYWGLVVSSALAFFDIRYTIVSIPLYFVISACGVTSVLNGARHISRWSFQELRVRT